MKGLPLPPNRGKRATYAVFILRDFFVGTSATGFFIPVSQQLYFCLAKNQFLGEVSSSQIEG